MFELTEWELEKYKRQIMIPGFGEEAQQKMKNSSALVTRLGGLGGPTAIWLAAAGIGKLVIAHGGKLTPSNLNRQILMRGDSVGEPRIGQAVETLKRFNPDVEIIAYGEDANDANAEAWVAQVDVVCDTTPDFNERLALNRACWKLGRPLVDSGMNGMEAQLAVFVPGQTGCLQCIVPQVPDWWDPMGFGVLGALPGALGAFTALEAIKVLTGYGETLADKGKMLVFDGEDLSFDQYDIYRNPDCPVCGAGAKS